MDTRKQWKDIFRKIKNQNLTLNYVTRKTFFTNVGKIDSLEQRLR
jgi:hypothetical protein